MLAAALWVAAASFAPPGAAAEGTPPVLPQVLALPDAVAVATDAAAISAAAVELAGSVLPTLPAAPTVMPISVSSPEPPATAPPPTPQAADITPEAPDTGAGKPTPAEPVVPDKPPAATVAAIQVQPVNVNVSVRVASPGDDGAVTQLNASLAGPSADAPVPTATAPASGLAAHSEPLSVEAQPSSTAGSLNGQGEQAVRVRPDSWTWNWNCRDSPTGIPALADSLSAALPANWNWNWDCGEGTRSGANTTAQLPNQYQVSATQYQPVNINVSVRIASPGENGPVVQTNLAMTVATTVATASSSTVPSGRPPPAVPPVLTVVTVEAAAAPVAIVEALSALAANPLTLVLGGAVALERLEEADEALRVGLLGWGPDESEQRVVREPRRIPDRLATPPVTQTAPVTALSLSRLAASQRERADATNRAAPDAKQPPRAVLPPPAPLPSLPRRVPLATLTLGGAAPGTGGDNGFLFLLLIPFALALAEAARCVTRERPAILAQVESSRRERPG